MDQVAHIEPIVDIIIEYLPLHVQLFIDKKRYTRAIKVFRNAKDMIVRNIVYNRNRMNMIIEMDLEEQITLPMVRAHYILHYPDNQRLHFYQHALAMKLRYQMPTKINIDLSSLDRNPKYLFRQIINDMSLDEIFCIGW